MQHTYKDMKVYIDTNGCAILRHETYRLSKYFRLNNFEEVDDVSQADIVVVTGCGVTDPHESEALELLDNIKIKMKASATVIVSGCLPKINQEQILAHVPQALLIGYDKSYEFDKIIHAEVKLDSVYYNTGHPYKYYFDNECFDDDPNLNLAQKIDEIYGTDIMTKQYTYSTPRHFLWKESDVFQIRVSYGCGGNCSYCATKLGIGNFKSIAPEKLYTQLREGLSEGFKRFVLVGDEIGFYGTDIGTDLATLIDEMHAIAPDIQVAIRYIYPDMLAKYYARLKKYFESGYIYYFCSAMQTASPILLKMMNRNPNIDEFVECIKDIRRNNYPVMMHTHIMVGFPSETDQDIAITLQCLMECDFDFFNINKFSMRKNTKAYKYKNLQLSEEVIQKRFDLMNAFLRISTKARLYDKAKYCILNKESHES